MKDIFISHSSNDITTALEICAFFEKYGLTCWLSERKEDLPAGENYMMRIIRAIDSSRLFFILLSNDAVSSEQVMQELSNANSRQKYGLKIFPIVIADDLNTAEAHQKCDYVISNKQTTNWAYPEEREKLLREVRLSLNVPVTADTARLVTTLPDPVRLVGRAKELDQLKKALNDTGRVLVTGMGGIGKTALLCSFANEAADRYKTVIYLSNDRCLMRTIGSNSQLCLEYPGLEELAERLTDYEYAMYKLALLENSADADTLLIIDNLDSENDILLERLCSIKCRLVVAMRCASASLKGFAHIALDRLSDPGEIRELFEQHYGERIADEEASALMELLNSVNGHAMMIVLLAKQMRYFGKRPGEYSAAAQLRLERYDNIRELIGAGDPELVRMYAGLFEMFDAGTLNDKEKIVMKTMCIVPHEGIDLHRYIELMGSGFMPAIKSLEEMGWLERKAAGEAVMMHPLVKDVALHELDLHVDDPDLGPFLAAFFRKIAGCYEKAFSENIKYKELALSVCHLFPEPSIGRYKDYLKLSKYLWVINCTDLSLELNARIKQMFIGSDGKHANSPEEAETMLQMGFTYHGRGEYSEAAKELRGAAAIYGDNFAKALSHLGQAYAEEGKKPLEEVEPLMAESLQIRQQYNPDSLPVAISMHLYAKVLCAYNAKPDYAIKLEKQAVSLWRRLQPGSVSLSSSLYLLGWLYVQTADDDEDVKFGISTLEEARAIREHRRDPLNPWMEEIYLKLGLSYEKANDHENAAKNYKLLRDVCEKKYKDPANRSLIGAYRLLMNAYERIGNTAGVKECRTYLRRYEL